MLSTDSSSEGSTGNSAVLGSSGTSSQYFGGHGGAITRQAAAAAYGTFRAVQALARGAAIEAAYTRAAARVPMQFSFVEHPFATVTPGVSKETINLGVQINKALQSAASARGAKKAAHEQALAEKLMRKQSKKAAQLVPSVTYSAEYGVAHGLPVRGSRDDPGGALYPNVTHSLLL